MKETRDVLEFHAHVGIEVPTEPTVLSDPDFYLCVSLIDEEFGEFLKAWGSGDFAGQVHELIDLLYVTHGALVRMGVLQTQELWDEVHEQNMTKKGGAIDARGKYIKTSDFVPADITGVLRRIYGKCPD